jgi:hypothetical protein
MYLLESPPPHGLVEMFPFTALRGSVSSKSDIEITAAFSLASTL